MSNITGQRLKELRKDKKKTQADIAALLGLTEGAYRHYESGAGSLDAAKIAKLAVYFGVTSDYLLGLSDDPNPIVTIAAHADEDLTPEAQRQIREYAELIRMKLRLEKEKGKK